MELSELKIPPQTDAGVVCAFTGNRPSRLPWGERETDERCVAVKEKIYRAVRDQYDRGRRLFVCGMARGADFYFAEAVIRLKKEKSDVLLEAAAPYPEQSRGWSVNDRIRYDEILDECDCVTVVSRTASRWAPLARNEYMVNKSSVLLALSYSTSGGAAYTIAYAKKKKREIIVINE